MDPNNMPDPFLSQYYGTSVPEPTDGDSLEKMAQLHLLEKLAEDEEIDLSQYSDEEILAMTDQVFGEDSGGHESQYGNDGDYEKVAAARFEEADYLGRVMAHSMWNELEAIQKAAAAAGPGKMVSGPKSEAAFDKEVADLAKKKRVAAARAADAAKYEGPAMAGRGASGARSVGKAEGAARSALHKMKRPGAKGKAALVAGGAAALGAGALLGARALKKRKEEQQKTASALDTLSDSRAFDILASYGYVDDQGGVIPPDGQPGQAWDVPFQKTASAELDEAIEEMAWGKLYDLGYLGE